MDIVLQIMVGVVVAVVSGAVSSLMTVAAIKTDIAWLKTGLSRAHERIDLVERR